MSNTQITPAIKESSNDNFTTMMAPSSTPMVPVTKKSSRVPRMTMTPSVAQQVQERAAIRAAILEKDSLTNVNKPLELLRGISDMFVSYQPDFGWDSNIEFTPRRKSKFMGLIVGQRDSRTRLLANHVLEHL